VRNKNIERNTIQVVVIGLGYVGLPLAVEFGKKYDVVGVDIDARRIEDLGQGYDKTQEVSKVELLSSTYLKFSAKLDITVLDKSKRAVFIITVPTPIDSYKKPDLSPLKGASKSVGEVLKKGDIVVYESTVFPGCTEEECVPVLEHWSSLKFNLDFYCGYSPERINPGDKVNTLTRILKITSGSTPEVSDFVDELYKSIITAGTYKASGIRVAEAAKLIENCQRDVNISFVNELALIFDRMNIDTNAVLEAAGTKWNFLRFKPGLVGGHCIGVDPYYMIHKAGQLGYYPEVIGAGRRINDNMGQYVANKAIKHMVKEGLKIKGANALILGFTFKENCPDIRNTKVIDIYTELLDFGLNVEIYDPWVTKEEVHEEYGLSLNSEIKDQYDLVVLAVAHSQFIHGKKYKKIFENSKVLFDIKSCLENASLKL
jgi:UDP-N-acetyl-D-galactosamine dehydrogenase